MKHCSNYTSFTLRFRIQAFINLDNVSCTPDSGGIVPLPICAKVPMHVKPIGEGMVRVESEQVSNSM